MLKKSAIFVHRWLGVALCLVFLLWFPSGIGMMYWDFPSVGAGRPAGAIAGAGRSTDQAVAGGGGGRARRRRHAGAGAPQHLRRASGLSISAAGRGGAAIVYADTGEEQLDVSKEMMDAHRLRLDRSTGERRHGRADRGGRPVDGPERRAQRPAAVEVLVAERRAGLHLAGRPARWCNTRRPARGSAPTSAPFRTGSTSRRSGSNGPAWSRVVIWSSGIGTCRGDPRHRRRRLDVFAVEALSLSTARRPAFRIAGRNAGTRVFGLIFGLGAATWAFSGMLSMDPFPMRRTGGPAGGGRRGGDRDSAGAARPRRSTGGVRGQAPARGAGAAAEGLQVKELELTSFAGEPVYLATLVEGRHAHRAGERRAAREEFDVSGSSTS